MGLTFVHPDYASWAKTIASVGMLTFSLIGASLGVWKVQPLPSHDVGLGVYVATVDLLPGSKPGRTG